MSPEAPSRARWAGVPPETRRAERRAILLDAAYDLLGREGFDATTVRAVCQRARLNPRYFYESFDDLDRLLVAVYDRVVAQLSAQFAVAHDSTSTDPRAQLRASINTTVSFIDDDPRRGRVLYVEGLGNEALNRRRRQAGVALVEIIDRDTSARAGHAPTEQIGKLASAIFVGGFTELLVAWLEGRIEVSRDQLVDDATELLMGLAMSAVAIAARR